MDRPGSTNLEHHGVKGQKWGVRRKDRSFARKAQSTRVTLKVYNAAAKWSNEHDLDRINNKPQYKNADFTRDTPLRQKYYKEHQDAFINALEKSAAALGTNASGTKRYGILEGTNGSWDIILKDVSHADGAVANVQVKYSKGRIVSIGAITPSAMAHSVDDLIEDILSHHGIKGMHWGTRRTSTEISDDAANAKAVRTKHKASGKQALSNKELQDFISRMNLEKQFDQFTPSGQAKSFVLDFLKSEGKQQVKAFGKEQVTKLAKSAAGK